MSKCPTCSTEMVVEEIALRDDYRSGFYICKNCNHKWELALSYSLKRKFVNLIRFVAVLGIFVLSVILILYELGDPQVYDIVKNVFPRVSNPQAHFPLDYCGSILVGIAAITLSIRWLDYAIHHPQPDKFKVIRQLNQTEVK